MNISFQYMSVSVCSSFFLFGILKNMKTTTFIKIFLWKSQHTLNMVCRRTNYSITNLSQNYFWWRYCLRKKRHGMCVWSSVLSFTPPLQCVVHLNGVTYVCLTSFLCTNLKNFKRKYILFYRSHFWPYSNHFSLFCFHIVLIDRNAIKQINLNEKCKHSGKNCKYIYTNISLKNYKLFIMSPSFY